MRSGTIFFLLVSMVSCSSERGPSKATPPPATNPAEPPSATAPVNPSDGQRSLPEASPRSEDPGVRFVGRFDDRDPERPRCGWPGCRIIASFEGVAISVRLDEAVGYDGPSEWDVAIDGDWRPKVVMQAGPHEYDLATGLPPGKHRVELYKRSESQTGVTTFLGFDLRGGALLAPPARASRLIEVVGDSDVAGYGYWGALTGGDCNGQPWLARYQDFRAGWGARLAEKLGADLHGTVFSGKGFYFNAWRPDLETIDVLYARANPEDPSSTFDLGRRVPDAIVVAIGGNDFNVGVPTDDGPPPPDAYTAKVRSFAGMLRSSYPQAHLFLTVYAALSDEHPPGRMTRTNVTNTFRAVVAEHNARGDARVWLVVPAQYTSGELTACDGHGGPAYHERIANYLAGEVGSRLGWR